jgi:hypothetical protein
MIFMFAGQLTSFGVFSSLFLSLALKAISDELDAIRNGRNHDVRITVPSPLFEVWPN